jgi:methyl-accepting chemotaxis protein
MPKRNRPNSESDSDDEGECENCEVLRSKLRKAAESMNTAARSAGEIEDDAIKATMHAGHAMKIVGELRSFIKSLQKWHEEAMERDVDEFCEVFREIRDLADDFKSLEESAHEVAGLVALAQERAQDVVDATDQLGEAMQENAGAADDE